MSTSFVLSYAALWVLVIFQSLLLIGLVKAVHRLKRAEALRQRDPGEFRGREVPQFIAVDVAGGEVNSADFERTLTALLFVSPDCRSCSLTLAEMNALKLKANGNVVVICRGGRDQCRELGERYELAVPVLVDSDLEISALFSVTSVPTAVLVNEDNRIQSYGHPMRGGELEDLFSEDDNAAVPDIREAEREYLEHHALD